MKLSKAILLCSCVLFFSSASHALEDNDTRAWIFWNRITGVVPTAAERASLKQRLDGGMSVPQALMQTALQSHDFINASIFQWAAELVDPQNRAYGADKMNQAVAIIMMTIARDRNIKEIFTGTEAYYLDPARAKLMPMVDYLPDNDVQERERKYVRGLNLLLGFQNGLDMVDYLVAEPLMAFQSYSQGHPYYEPEPLPMTERAGILSTDTFAKFNYSGGTNRRGLPYLWRKFFGVEMLNTRDNYSGNASIMQSIRKDIPQNIPAFSNVCLNCHGSLDPMAAAFAYMDYRNGTFLQNQKSPFAMDPNVRTAPIVQPKYARHNAYAGGTDLVNSTWSNHLTSANNQQQFGWTRYSGNSLADFGDMLANARGFSEQMVRTFIRKFCKYDPTAADEPLVARMASDLRGAWNGNMKVLAAELASVRGCIE